MGLDQTSSWAVATVCAIFVVVSLLVEAGINYLGRWLRKKKMKPLSQTLEKIKDELMVLGFISLLLTVFQPVVASLCMPERLRTSMLPCPYEKDTNETSSCPVGKVQIISVEGLHQLHLFIFVLAIVHVFYSCTTVLLGLLQMHKWKKWEQETRQESFDCAKEAMKHEHNLEQISAFSSTGIKYPKPLRAFASSVSLWFGSFFHQFYSSVERTDYLTLRVGFLATHKLSKNYDFHKYIQRTMEVDFKVIVGIRAYLWIFGVAFLLINVHGLYMYFYGAFVPLVMILIIGAKLQKIICELTHEVRGCVKRVDKPATVFTSRHTHHHADNHGSHSYTCTPIRLRDDLFWFKNPRFMLHLIHLVFFQNAFELAFFFWILYTFGFHSCMMGKAWMVGVRLAIVVSVQWMCSYSTLPLYALVTQMGTKLRHSVFEEGTVSALHGWHNRAKVKLKQQKHSESGEKLSDRLSSIFKGASSSHHNGSSHNDDSSHAIGSESLEDTEAGNSFAGNDISEPNLPDGSDGVETSNTMFGQQSASDPPAEAASNGNLSVFAKLLMSQRHQQREEDQNEQGNDKSDHTAEFNV